MDDNEDKQENISIGIMAYTAINEAKAERWGNRPICCGSKVKAFDDGSFICGECDTVYED